MSYQEIKKNIEDIAKNQCRLIAVSKQQSIEKILNLYSQGQRIFAENYVQELLEKKDKVNKKDIQWHFIGPIQTNKINKIVGEVELIHSVDNEKAIVKINSVAKEKKLFQKILIQVNLSGEETKSGVIEDDIDSLLDITENMQNVVVIGFMTMPPPVDDPQKSRIYFQKLNKILIEKKKKYNKLKELSMGTTQDYFVAMEEGATYVRIGEAVFGKRV